MQSRPRTRKEIAAEHSKYFDKVWWNRHMSHHEHDHDGGIGCEAARALEDRYSMEFLHPGENDIEWGICLGKYMALGWMLGFDWDEAGDT